MDDAPGAADVRHRARHHPLARGASQEFVEISK
jgi:hypothetical protein